MAVIKSINVTSCAIVTSIMLGVGLLTHAPAASAQDKPVAAQQPIQLQAWQTRRAERLQIIKTALSDTSIISNPFGQMLTNFESHPLEVTPLENMDLLGYFYAPREGIAKAIPVIVMNTTLGWYDALRFASPSGQAEIVNNEGFFKRVFILSGQQRTNEFLEFAKAHPGDIRAAVDQGLAFSDKFKDSGGYDHKWPTAYGLERIICAQGGACTSPTEAPQSQWNALWEQAKLRVRSYYQIK